MRFACVLAGALQATLLHRRRGSDPRTGSSGSNSASPTWERSSRSFYTALTNRPPDAGPTPRSPGSPSSNAAFSDYDPESELMRLCDQAGGPPVKVSEDLFRILTLARHWSEASDGAFDVTIGPVGRLWRRARRTREMPDAE